MKLHSFKKNMTEVVQGNPETTILFSYKTPVAAHIEGKGTFLTSEHYSATTTRHINDWYAYHGFTKSNATIVPPDFFDTLHK